LGFVRSINSSIKKFGAWLNRSEKSKTFYHMSQKSTPREHQKPTHKQTLASKLCRNFYALLVAHPTPIHNSSSNPLPNFKNGMKCPWKEVIHLVRDHKIRTFWPVSSAASLRANWPNLSWKILQGCANVFMCF
jgi:hypothetical protein